MFTHRKIHRPWGFGSTDGVAFGIGPIEIGFGYVTGEHVWFRLRWLADGSDFGRRGKKIELQFWRLIVGIVFYL